MWEFDWSTRQRRSPQRAQGSDFSDDFIDRQISGSFGAAFTARYVAPLLWEEHCFECAVPECYTTCPLYLRRADGACARFINGIQPRPELRGFGTSGAEVRFRTWGKLETEVPTGFISPRAIRGLTRLDRCLGALLREVARLIKDGAVRRRLLSAYAWRRKAYLARIGRHTQKYWRDAEFICEVVNLGDENRLVVETSEGGLGLNRKSFDLPRGETTTIRFPYSPRSKSELGSRAQLTVAPEEESGAHLRFRALDIIVPMPRQPALDETATESGADARYVKCVVWDLDNVLWHGTLAEQAPDSLPMNPDADMAVREFDRRGLLQSIVSKNDYDPAWSAVESAGLAEFFLVPSISWEPKSHGIAKIASALNLGLDSFLLIDDSPFERAEVSHAYPQVRTADSVELAEVLQRPEMNPPLTSESHLRRVRYQEEGRRSVAAAGFDADYEAFLKSCEMRAEVFVPNWGDEKARCLELIQRSNQLNFSGRGISATEFTQLSNDPEHLWLSLRMSDRFGDYGLVGVLGLARGDRVLYLTDLCISCRVARKYAEQALFRWLGDIAQHRFSTLEGWMVVNDRNGPMRSVLADTGFVVEESAEGRERVVLRLGVPIVGAGIVTMKDSFTGSGADPWFD